MSRESFLDCIARRPHEGVPSFMFDTSFGTGFSGYRVSEVYGKGFDGEKSARSICAGRKYLGHDAVPGSMISMDTRELGAEIELYDDRPAMLTKPAFKEPDRLYDSDPSDIVRCATVDEIIRSNNLIKETDPEAVVAAYVPSPFLFSAVLRGLEPLLMDMVNEPDYVKELMEFTTGCCEGLARRHIDETESECSIIPGAYDNPDLISLDDLDRICIPSLKRVRSILSRDSRPVIFHPHGALTVPPGRNAFESFVGTGFDCIYYGENCDHGEMCRIADGKVSVMGGIDTATTIFLGDDDTVRKDTKSVLEATDGYDFIYSCSCSIDRNLNAGKLKVMMDTVLDHFHRE
ncbi:MAG: hypothetical protein IK043_03650 [Candidatus Methanomethylophilaceae archaeon]|nr:hypothetical protein [Candidatus Methanomethylophilaceae archaeon]